MSSGFSDNLSDFENDFEFLHGCRTIAIDDILAIQSGLVEPVSLEEGRLGRIQTRKDGRKIRLVYPHGYEALSNLLSSASALWFVGFIGCTQTDTNQSGIRARVWSYDGKLMKELQNHPGIFAYITGEREIDGDWGNLVLLANEDGVHQWSACDIHFAAVREISPLFYKLVRIHRGRLPNGILSKTFTVDRTLLLAYENKKLSHRAIKTWNENSQSKTSPLMAPNCCHAT